MQRLKRILGWLKGILGWLFVVAWVALVVDYYRVNAKEQRVFLAIAECGGTNGSIPFWPFGTEYRVKFPHALTSDQLDRLVELNSLRGSVKVAFVECELSADQVGEIESKLYNCKLRRITNGEMSQLAEGVR